MSVRIKRTCRWLLMVMICLIGAHTLTGCIVHDDHGHDHGHDFHHDDDHRDWH
jgi:hypothetical protein